MLKPSYAELMDVLNENADEDSNEVTSRYTIVIAAAKRARQLIDGDEPMVASPDGKPVTTAVNELNANKIKIVPLGQGTVLDIYKNNDKEQDDINKKEEILMELENAKINNEALKDEAEVISEDFFEDEDKAKDEETDEAEEEINDTEEEINAEEEIDDEEEINDNIEDISDSEDEE